MKINYIVEYTRNSTGKSCADIFPTKAAAFKFTRDPSITCERVIELYPNGKEKIIVENKYP